MYGVVLTRGGPTTTYGVCTSMMKSKYSVNTRHVDAFGDSKLFSFLKQHLEPYLKEYEEYVVQNPYSYFMFTGPTHRLT